MSRRRVLLAAGVAALVFGAAACGGGGGRGRTAAPQQTPPGQAASPVQVGAASMTIALPGDPTNWNALAAPGDSGDPLLQAVTSAVWPSAFTVGAAGTPVPNRELIASAAASGGGTTITYRLNPRAVWSDGVPVGAADFAATWRDQSGRAGRDVGGARFTPASTAGYADVTGVTSPATGTVVVSLRAPDPDWQALFGPLLPAHIAGRIGFDHGFTNPVTDLVSAGPWVVQSWLPGTALTLVRNPRWWGPDAGLASVRLDVLASPAEAAPSLATGQIDAAVLPFGEATSSALHAASGLAAVVGRTGAYDDLVANQRSGPLADPTLRRALWLAIDRSSLVAAARRAGDDGASVVADRFRPPGAAGYADSSRSLVPAGQHPGVAGAEALLAAAGYHRQGGALVRGGTPVTLTLTVDTPSPLAAHEVTVVGSAAAALGIRLTVRPAGPGAAAAVAGHHFQLAITSVDTTAYPGPDAAAWQAGPEALAGAPDPAVAADLQQASTEPDGATRWAALAAADRAAWSDAVDLPLLWQPGLLVAESRYQGLTVAPYGPPGGIAAAWTLSSTS